ncbi:MAG: tRNA pseudouridine(55) synthase TruB [Rudaea sp.]
MSSSESRILNPESRRLTGILLLDKPRGLSSNQALQKAKHIFSASKAGHTGSLDPLATGLLPVCFGEATKIAGHLLGARKAYAAQIRLGVTTETDDAEGTVAMTRPVPQLTAATIESALAGLRGRIVQTPPVYSALKQGGVPLYKRARRGEQVHVEPREVEVHRLELEQFEADHLAVQVECGSGTYVRSLARDLGERLGCGAHLTSLRRLWVEPFVAPMMFDLETLKGLQEQGGNAAVDALLLPIEAGLAGLPALHLDSAQSAQMRHGQRLQVVEPSSPGLHRALNPQGQLVALVDIGEEGFVTVTRGFNPDQTQVDAIASK